MQIKKFHQLFESYSDNILDAKRVIDNLMDSIPCSLRIGKGLGMRNKNGVYFISKTTDENVQGDISESGLLPVFSYGYYENTSFFINSRSNFMSDENEKVMDEFQDRVSAIFGNNPNHDFDIETHNIRLDVYKQVPKLLDVRSVEWESICQEIKKLDGKLLISHQSFEFEIPLEHTDEFFNILSEFETDIPEDYLMGKHKACKITNSSNGKDLILIFNTEPVYGGFNPEPTHLKFKITSNDANLSLYYLLDPLKDALK